MITSKLGSRSDSKFDDDRKSVENEDDVIVNNAGHDEDSAKFFPVFQDDRDLLFYKRSRLGHFDLYSTLPLVIMYVVAFATRSNLPSITTSGPIFASALAIAVICLGLYAAILVPIVINHFGRSPNHSVVHLMARKFLDSRMRQLIEQIVPVSLSLSTGLFLYARVRAGQCENITDMWTIQSCNPYENNLSIPHDQTILCYLGPLLMQFLMKGSKFQLILLSWAMSTVFIAISLVFVKGLPELWTLLYSLFFLFVVIENERLMRISYIENKRVMRHEYNREEFVAAARTHSHAIEKARYELQIIALQAEKDKQDIESERARLRSLIGNVAHDLKTPLQSIGMSIELLRDDLRTSLRKGTVAPEVQNAVNLLTLESVNVTLDSLTSMSSFMAMAINRCLDFTKASSGITLVPSMETIDLVEALAIPVDCINNLQSDTTIVVDPIPLGVCNHIITDKHWLIENILCLLSNATKYSTCGEVNLMLELDFQTHEFLSHKILRVTIEDSGIGIPNEARQKLFQPFTQAQRMTGGTGLGLYSLSKRMEALGGGYGVHDRRDGKQGSAFWISFPYRPDHMFESKGPLASKQSEDSDDHGSNRMVSVSRLGGTSSSHPSGGPILCKEPSFSVKVPSLLLPSMMLHILIVEDSLSILKVVCQMLKQKGHIVETAQNGSLGLDRMIECYSSNDFDVVLMDLQMPIMDGIEATRRFREFERQQKRRLSSAGLSNLDLPNTLKNGNSSPSSINHNTAFQRYDGDAVETRGASPERYQYGCSSIDGDTDDDRDPSRSLSLPMSMLGRDRDLGQTIPGPFVAKGQSPAQTIDALLKRQSRTHDENALPIIGMSANSDSYSKDCALQAGMNHFLAKPFTMGELHRVLEMFRKRNINK